MDLKNCVECGKLFVHPSRDVCPKCYDDEEADFKKVREYLWDKFTSSVDEIHEMTGVATKRIVKFIRTGRLSMAGLKVNLYLNCEGCGEPIKEGRFCPQCRDRIVNHLNEGTAKKVEEEKEEEPEAPKRSFTRAGKMYTADRFGKR